MLSTLSEWSNRCSTTLSSLESQIASIKAEAQRRHRDEQDWNTHVEKLIEKLIEMPQPESNVGERHGERQAPSGMMGSLHSMTSRMTRSSGKRNATLADPNSDEDMDDFDSMDGPQMKDTRSSKKRGFAGLGFGK